MVEKKPFDESKMHHGHRARLLDSMVKAGITNLSDVQAMEFILFYIFPRGDVNPLAHRLLHRFGNVANVLSASIEELKEIKGMGDRSAKSLSMLSEIFFYYTEVKLSEKICLNNYQVLADYMEELLRFEPVEKFVMLGLDASMKIIERKIMAKGSVKMVGLSPLNIAKFVASCHPLKIVLAHNHPGGSCKPSSQDVDTNVKLKAWLKTIDVELIDHIIVGDDGIYSCFRDEYVRCFSDDLKDFPYQISDDASNDGTN